MKKSTVLSIFFILFVCFVFPLMVKARAPRTFGAWGTATTTNATVTTTIGPISLCVSNDAATEPLYVDISDGVATTSSGGTNFRIKAAETRCYSWGNVSVLDTVSIGLITAATTADYRIEAISK